jgi:hypothetical protein
MASKRRGGFGTPELRGTLGTLLRTTTGAVRDALQRGAREGRARFEDVRASRRRQDALAELGELVLALIRKGEIDLAELPEARELVRQLDDFEAESADEPALEPPRATSRSRFDDRARRPAPAPADLAGPDDHADPDDDDGTVSSGAIARHASAASGTASSGATRRTNPGVPRYVESAPASTRVPTKPIKNSWRPTLDDAPTIADMPAAKRSLLPHDPQRRGGISFDDDDLNEYMHPDDVPPKGPSKNPGDGDA